MNTKDSFIFHIILYNSVYNLFLMIIKIIKLRVGIVKQNISFAGEALEQVGDGRG